jgi:hypothetical protein
MRYTTHLVTILSHPNFHFSRPDQCLGVLKPSLNLRQSLRKKTAKIVKSAMSFNIVPVGLVKEEGDCKSLEFSESALPRGVLHSALACVHESNVVVRSMPGSREGVWV